MPDPTGRVSHVPEMHRGFSWKPAVRCATTANITISSALNNGDSIDGVTLVTGDRVLVKNQSTASQNGIYIVGATPVRAADMDQDGTTSVPAEEIAGAMVFVISGTTNAQTLWHTTNAVGGTLGSTSIVWTEFTAGASGTDLGWFDVEDYGAVHDGSTDDTVAIQAAIDACNTAGGGTVWFPAGVYIIGGALQDTGAFNGQLLLPNVSHSGDHIVMTFKGALRPGFHPVYGDTVPLAAGFSVLKSTLTGASGTAACISGSNDLGTTSGGHGNNLEVYVDDLICLGPDNPTFTFWNLGACQGGGIGALQISTPGAYAGSPTQPTHSNAYGIKLPQIYFANSVDVGTLSVGGFYTGVLDGELVRYKSLILGPLIVGVEIPATFYPSIVIGMTSSSVQRVLKGTGDHRFDVLQYAAEHYSGGGWQATVYDVDDASNHIYGYIRWFNAATGGTADHSFTINGGANVGNQEMGATWGNGTPSFATPSIVLGSAAAAGAASTVIRSDSTIAAFDTTVPVTQAFGDTAATGSAAFAARRDHKHGMPATPTGTGAILIADTHSTPLIFADLLQTEAEDDLLYGD